MRTAVLAAMLASVLAIGGCAGSTGGDAGGNPSAPPPAPSGGPASTAAPGSAQPPQSTVVKFTVRGGKRVDGPDRIDARPGETVRIEVTSDVHDELHVHGYDRKADLAAGVPGAVTFTADIPGAFEVELHHSGAKLGQLRVSR